MNGWKAAWAILPPLKRSAAAVMDAGFPSRRKLRLRRAGARFPGRAPIFLSTACLGAPLCANDIR